jgi:hypothetical protein
VAAVLVETGVNGGPIGPATCGDYGWQQCADGDLECVMARESTECASAAKTDLDAAACVADLGGPFGVCGENGCGSNDDCSGTDRCVDYICTPE